MGVVFVLVVFGGALLGGGCGGTVDRPVADSSRSPERVVGNFGGGRVVRPPGDPLGRGNIVIGLRALPSGRLQIDAKASGGCAGVSFAAQTRVRRDGSFRAAGLYRFRDRFTVRYDITGTLTAAGANGIARVRHGRRGERDQGCMDTVAFAARRPTGTLGTPGARPDRVYLGVTSQRRGGPRRGIVLRVSPDGRRLARVLYLATTICGGVAVPNYSGVPRRNIKLDARGRFGVTERYYSRERATTTTYVERFSGQLGSAGAKGTFSVTQVATDRRTGAIVADESCKTGNVRWTASS